MTKLQVKAQLPKNAHARMPADTPVTPVSKHSTTPRGVRNALTSYQDVVTDYAASHGNMAAFRVWIEYKGETLAMPVLRDMVLSPDWSDFEVEYCAGWTAQQKAQAYLDEKYKLE
jgi:hypothetical protein